jgi:phospholipid transport system substrate-binding protein
MTLIDNGTISLRIADSLCAVLLAFTVSTSAWSQPTQVEQLVDETSQTILQLVRDGRGNFEENPQVLYGQIDEVLEQVIDYPYIARGVMGSFYKQATPEQYMAFTAKFKSSIVQIVTSAIVHLEAKSISVLPLTQPPSSRARVTMEVTTANDKSFSLVYNMVLAEDKWRVRNIIIDGINIGLTYRNQFKSMMGEAKNDIDVVISNWSAEQGQQSTG